LLNIEDAIKVEVIKEDTNVFFELSVLVVSVELTIRNPDDIDEVYSNGTFKEDKLMLIALVVLVLSVELTVK
jgi:hypothetical protein